jgi:hypothetical protein
LNVFGAVGVLVAGIVTVVATIAIYLCAKVAVQMYLRQDGSKGVERDTTPFNGGSGGNTARDVDEADVEMGTMSFFIEGVQNERPVRFSSTQLRGFTQGQGRSQKQLKCGANTHLVVLVT